jgi:DNA-binding Xre family transcriptional regulator
MKVSYKKLWKLLIDRELKKRDLADKANVSVATLTKLAKGENVNVDILVRVCSALECDLTDIMELIPDAPNNADS